jgi:hypothetical protein
MQPYRPKFTTYKPKYTVPTFTEEDETRRALETQRASLEERLQGVGVNPDDLGDVDNRNFIQKALNLDEDKGLLMSTFEILNRPQQAVVSGLTGEGFMKGLTGENTMTGVEFLDKMGVVDKREVEGVGAFALNMAVGMVTDPLMYTGGPLKLLGKATKGARSKYRLATTQDVVNRASIKANEILDGQAGELIPKLDKKVEAYKTTKDGFRVYDEQQFSKAFKQTDGIYESLSGKGLKDVRKATTVERETTQLAAKYVKDTFGQYSDDLVFVKEATSGTKQDIVMFQKIMRDGKENLVEVGSLEVKYFEDNAFLASANFDLVDSKIKFSKRSKFAKTYSDEVLKKFVDTLETMDFQGNEKLKTLLTKLKDGQLIGKAGKVKKSYDLSPEELKILNETFREIGFEKYKLEPFIGFPGKDGNIKIVSSEDVLKQADFSAYFNLDGGTPRLQVNFGKNVDLDSLDDFSEEYFNQFFEKRSIISGQIPTEIREPGALMSFINRKALEQESILRRPAQIVKSAVNSINFAFNANYDLGSDFVGLIRRIRGRAGQILHSNNRLLRGIKTDLTAQNANAGKLLGEISETTFEVSGTRLIAKDRVYSVQDIAENFVNNSRAGVITTLPKFKNPTMARNFQDTLNDVLEVYGVQVVVETKGNATRLILDQGGTGELDDLYRSIKSGIHLGETKLSFGTLEISQEAQEFYFKNQDKIQEYIKLQESLQDILVQELGYENIPTALAGKMGYMRHTLTREAKKGLREVSQATASAYASRGVDTLKQRTFLGSVDEVNAALSEWGNIPFDVLDPDAFNAMEELIRVTSTKLEQEQVLKAVMEGTNLGGDSLFKVFSTRRVALDDLGPEFKIFEKGFKTEFANLYKNLSPSNQKYIDQFFEELGGGTPVAAFAMHKSAFNIIKQIDRAYIDLPDMVKGYDKFLNYWKSITLVSPGFHMRNLFGNYSNSYIAGMSFPEIMSGTTNSISDFRVFYRVKDQALKQGIDSLPAADQEIYKRVLDFFESGVAQSQKGTRDLETLKEAVAGNLLKGDTTKIKQAYRQLVKTNFDIAEYMDDIQRYSLYQWALKNKGKDIAKILKAEGATDVIIQNAVKARAYETVSGALFDYQNLTGFEKDVMKRMFPFYTFMKNNFIFQAKSLLAQPFKYAQMGRAYEYWNEDIGGITTEEMPEYMQENMWLAMPMRVRKDDSEAISFLKLNLTPSDFTELVENPFKKGVSSITAPVKLAIELGTGRDAFTGQPLERFPGEKRRLEAGEGVLPFLRDPRGNLALTSNPTIQKALNDLGFRVPQNYLSIALDGLDRIFGYKKAGEFAPALFDRLSLTGTQSIDKIELTRLYQDLERLRNLQSYYTQESGEPLPTLEELSRQQRTLPRLP